MEYSKEKIKQIERLRDMFPYDIGHITAIFDKGVVFATPTQFKVATEDSPEVLEKCCDNPNCRDTINYNKAPSISKPELDLNKAKDMLTRLVSQLGNEHVSEEYCEPLIEESQQLLSKLNKD